MHAGQRQAERLTGGGNPLEEMKGLGTGAAGADTEVRLQARCTEATDGLAFTLAAQGGTYRIVDWRMLPFEELEK